MCTPKGKCRQVRGLPPAGRTSSTLAAENCTKRRSLLVLAAPKMVPPEGPPFLVLGSTAAERTSGPFRSCATVERLSIAAKQRCEGAKEESPSGFPTVGRMVPLQGAPFVLPCLLFAKLRFAKSCAASFAQRSFAAHQGGKDLKSFPPWIAAQFTTGPKGLVN